MSDSLWPHDYTVHGILQARILEWIAFPFSRGLPYPGFEPRSPTLQADSLPAKPQGKPKNTGVDSLSLLQWIFPTQELNWGLQHFRQIPYQLSYQQLKGLERSTSISSLFFLTRNSSKKVNDKVKEPTQINSKYSGSFFKDNAKAAYLFKKKEYLVGRLQE